MKCYICEKEAVGRMSPDLDINGIGYCEEHKEDILIAYFILTNEGEKSFNRFIKSKR